ncbi:cupin domain-containing protein [Desulfobotulus mexicanus]|uniref:Cupin domain-containing protein n=1 Tax=Desulfobotulus mexicanus TaxID=2586642 RepID=A0A5S5MF40_9BACT|nr:cupin domain-containing protein [Desulfobotulus mexicanus]TYT74341.1 cupin domain-containing protein [Desulfobotulus mexicanus]
MEKETLIKNIAFSEAIPLASLVDYEEGRVVSRTLAQKKGVGMTLFAFAKGEGISAHASTGDAFVYILDGDHAVITIDEKVLTLKAGESVVMPAGIPHALDAGEPFKMLLVVVKPE